MQGELNWLNATHVGATAGEASKAEALERVEKGMDTDWYVAAMGAVKKLASVRDEFTTDDVWPLLRAYSTPEPRAMGAVMTSARGSKIIEATDKWKLSDRPSCNRRPVRVWRSVR